MEGGYARRQLILLTRHAMHPKMDFVRSQAQDSYAVFLFSDRIGTSGFNGVGGYIGSYSPIGLIHYLWSLLLKIKNKIK